METKKCIIKNDINEVNTLVSFVDELAEQWNIPMKNVFNINLALEEIVSNTIFYGYSDSETHSIEIEFANHVDYIQIKITDDAKEFNPLLKETPDDIDKPVEERKIGGLGIHIVKNIMFDLDYKRDANRNTLLMKNKI
ncbi:MAG: hypothetical protein A2X12_04825 [Bacteroidetes bacterium GWE2_29_8]|nr:MAG: hypothetical protein A2X12_04825 [Bacteroidetes bacterium GWE2_29_8]OFY24602.1 MAG: hypothetical protein A2X02_03310 [Bacteroidetes bacterium GWF2_29_10]